ncbi:MAG: hypothetical protein WCY88_08680 [Spongiibacteraceae bacterium]
MFNDRRDKPDRRRQIITVPSDLDRRNTSRRNKNYKSQPWWLRVMYADEETVESTVTTTEKHQQLDQPKNKAAKNRR